MLRRTLMASSIFGGLAFSTQVFAAAEVNYDTLGCVVGPVHVIQHADGFMSGSFDLIDTHADNPREGVLVGHCVGTFTVIGGEANSNGSCEYVNAAGDKYFGVFARKGGPEAEGTWRVVHGTGKFADMSEEGKYKSIGEFPPAGVANMISGCNHSWGTTKLK